MPPCSGVDEPRSRAAQPWSNGRVGVTGVSYSGDTAMLSLALGNAHITAAAPISYDFDPYEDLTRPGGILIKPVIDPYALLLRILDQAGGTTCATSALTEEVCTQAGLTGASPEPVAGPDGEALLATARAEHFPNANLVDMADAGVCRDYARGPQSWTVTSVGDKVAAIGAGRVPILTFAGRRGPRRTWNCPSPGNGARIRRSGPGRDPPPGRGHPAGRGRTPTRAGDARPACRRAGRGGAARRGSRRPPAAG
jgi:hypothetical protein